jgi:hypothetical protein
VIDYRLHTRMCTCTYMNATIIYNSRERISNSASNAALNIKSISQWKAEHGEIKENACYNLKMVLFYRW